MCDHVLESIWNPKCCVFTFRNGPRVWREVWESCEGWGGPRGGPSPFREALECCGRLWNVLPGSPPPHPVAPSRAPQRLWWWLCGSWQGAGGEEEPAAKERLSPGKGGLEQVFCLCFSLCKPILIGKRLFFPNASLMGLWQGSVSDSPC